MAQALDCKIYGHVSRLVEQGVINLDIDTIHIALLDDTHVFDVTNEFWFDVRLNEIAGAGYDEGGKELTHTGTKLHYDAATGIYAFGKNADDTVWINSSLTAHFAVIYNYIDHGGVPHDDSELLCCSKFDGAEVTLNTPFTITWPTTGIFRFRPNP